MPRCNNVAFVLQLLWRSNFAIGAREHAAEAGPGPGHQNETNGCAVQVHVLCWVAHTLHPHGTDVNGVRGAKERDFQLRCNLVLLPLS